MRTILIFLFHLLLIGCGEPEWKTKELERKAKVQVLIQQLSDESPERRETAFAALRDTYIRKLDFPMLEKEIDRNPNPEAESALWDLFLLTWIEKKWRLPSNEWTTDMFECARLWTQEIKRMGFEVSLDAVRDDDLYMTLPVKSEYETELIDLILDIEPASLELVGHLRASIDQVTFLGGLRWLNLENTGITGIPSLKGLHNLFWLKFQNSGVTDLSPLEDSPRIYELYLFNTEVSDLTPLKGMSNLKSLYLQNTRVADLTPLKGFPNLRQLDLQGTEVKDLTPLEGMPNLRITGKTK